MRKIDKTIVRSTEYRDWEAQLEASGSPHPPYNSSAGKYYTDIVMELLRCQGGLCAYTEVQLCAADDLKPEHWTNGRYNPPEKVNNGQLEHFDESLKAKTSDPNTQAKDWLWSNFFMVESDTNNRKGTKTVDPILKPDAPDYDPEKLLEYNQNTGFYLPNEQLDPATQQRVKYMLDVLGINFPNLVDKRKNKIAKALKFGVEAIEPDFPTAFAFCAKAG